MPVLLILISIPALIWAFQIPGFAGTILVFLVLAALFSGGGAAGPDILGRWTSVDTWDDARAGEPWQKLLCYRNLLAARESTRWGGPFFLRMAGWLSILLAVDSLSFAGILAYSLIHHQSFASPEVRWALYSVFMVAGALAVVFLLSSYQVWTHPRPIKDSQLIRSPSEAATFIREYLELCGGERIPGWFNFPLIRLLPAITTAVYHFGLRFAGGTPYGTAFTAISWVLVALMGYYALVLFRLAFVQWDNLQPERVCPCRFVPLQKLLRYARLVRNGGKPWYDGWLARLSGSD